MQDKPLSAVDKDQQSGLVSAPLVPHACHAALLGSRHGQGGPRGEADDRGAFKGLDGRASPRVAQSLSRALRICYSNRDLYRRGPP